MKTGRFTRQTVRFADGDRVKLVAPFKVRDEGRIFFILKEEAKHLYSSPFRVNPMILINKKLSFTSHNLQFIMSNYDKYLKLLSMI